MQTDEKNGMMKEWKKGQKGKEQEIKELTKT